VRGLLSSCMAASVIFGVSPATSASCLADLMSQDANALVASMEGASSPHLWHGSGCYSDQGDPNACDWATEIKADERIGADRRLVILNSSHRTGSGAWDYVRVYGCSAGQLELLFEEKFLYGVSKEEVSPEEIVLVAGYWRSGDPNCCPSARARHTLRWDSQKGRYLKQGFALLPLEKK